jgi:hypothetical protein
MTTPVGIGEGSELQRHTTQRKTPLPLALKVA